MTKKKALRIYKELKANCPELLLVGSTLRQKLDIPDLDLLWVGKIFPMHLLPVGKMEKCSVAKLNPEILRFIYDGEKIDIYRTDKNTLGSMLLHLTGPMEYLIYLKMISRNKGLELNQYGLFKGDRLIASKTEKEILKALDKKYLEPKERNKYRSINMTK